MYKPFTLVNASAVCWIMSCHLFRHHPGADSAHQKRANPRLRMRANIKLSLKYCVWMDKFTQKLCQNGHLGKYPSRHSRLSVQYQCILLKWQHFLNINQTATTKKSLTVLDWITFVTLIKINIYTVKYAMLFYIWLLYSISVPKN